MFEASSYKQLLFGHPGEVSLTRLATVLRNVYDFAGMYILS